MDERLKKYVDEVIALNCRGMAVLLILPELMEMFYMSGCRGNVRSVRSYHAV